MNDIPESNGQEGRDRQPILVTGAHRSGTSWVGKMLAAGRQVAYISEPLNVLHRPGVMRVPVERWYTYICEENEAGYLEALQATLRFHYNAWEEIRSLRSGKDIARLGRDWSVFQKGRLFGQRPLLKDPFAVFSASWFAERLNCAVVFTVRHPAAFASSLMRLGWPFNFADLLSQPLLMRDWLEPFRPEMEKALAEPLDLTGQSCLLWRMIYRAVDQQVKRQSALLIVRHEDLSRDPLEGFRSLYARLGLFFSQQVRESILHSSGSKNPAEISPRRAFSTRVDSQTNLMNWKRRLSQAEIERIRDLTSDVAKVFYTDADWE